MHLRVVGGACVFLFALIAGCASTPPRVANQPKVEQPPPAAPAPVVETLPSPPAAVAEIRVLPAREADLWIRIRSGFAMSRLE